LNYNTAIAGNDTIALTLGITLATTDVVTATSSSGNVSFVAFGAETGTLPVIVAPVINTITYTDSSYNAISETAIAPAGGYIKLAGSGFTSGSIAYVDGVAATATTYISRDEVRVQLPAKTVGNYSLMLFTSAGLGAIYANGIVCSSVPSWTASSYNNPTAGQIVNVQLLATGDVPLTYSLQSGSSLPIGVTLSSTGLVSGTATGISSTTTVTFTVVVSDVQLQTAPQLISLTLTFYIGKLWAWGNDGFGQLGDNAISYRSSPIQVGSSIDWKTVSVGYSHTTAIKTDGTLWTWGKNGFGQLGDSTTGIANSKSNPNQIGVLTTWLSVSAAGYCTAAVRTDGTLWTWGYNNNGQLGLGNTINTSSPGQVGNLTNWLSVSSGQYHIVAIKTDKTIWTWGAGTDGKMGLGNTTSYSSPKQIGSLTDWLRISAGVYHTAGIKIDGTLWTWGKNASGRLGLGDTLSRSSPVQVGLLTTWLSLAGGYLFSTAVKTDGTLWTWGSNPYGQLGLGNTTTYSSPKQVGALTTWKSTSTGWYDSLATKTGGTLWSWGYNYIGQLGLGDTINRSSPVQVGTLTNWTSVSAGNTHTAAISST